MITTILIIILLWAIPSAILLVFTCMCSSRYSQLSLTVEDLDNYESGSPKGGSKLQLHEIPTRPVHPLS